jgi:hypothetical protein
MVTQADIARAVRVVAKLDGWRVRITAEGEIILEPAGGDHKQEAPLEAIRDFRL